MSTPYTGYVPPLCPGADPGADWQEMGWCCHTCAAIAHLAWCPNHPGPTGPDAWACQRCAEGWFGPPPEDGLCAACREAHS